MKYRGCFALLGYPVLCVLKVHKDKRCRRYSHFSWSQSTHQPTKEVKVKNRKETIRFFQMQIQAIAVWTRLGASANSALLCRLKSNLFAVFCSRSNCCSSDSFVESVSELASLS